MLRNLTDTPEPSIASKEHKNKIDIEEDIFALASERIRSLCYTRLPVTRWV